MNGWSEDDQGLAKKLMLKAWRRLTPLDLDEHRDSLKSALRELQDALLRVERGTAARRTTQIAAKIGTTSALTSAMFGVAALLGTASTGTAIGTLSGAAFTSAALAWLGGSVAAGSVLVFVVPLAGGIAAYLGSKWAWRQYWSGSPRGEEDLDPQELAIVRGIDSVLVSLERDGDDARLHSFAYFMLWDQSLTPIIGELEARVHGAYQSWSTGAKRRLTRSVRTLKRLRTRAAGRLLTFASIPVGVFGSTVMELMSDDPQFTPNQELVFQAFRRSSNELETASPEDIGRYLKEMSPESRRGALQNVKGIYHELSYVAQENADPDPWKAELMMSANHPGIDLRKVNTETGEVIEVQLKSVSTVDGIREAQRRFQDVHVEATSEVAGRAGVESSGFSNEDLGREVSDAANEAQKSASNIALVEDSLEAGFNAAFVTLALSLGGAVLARQPLAVSSDESVRRAASAFKWASGTAILAELFT